MPGLRDFQSGFAAALHQPDAPADVAAHPGFAVYRTNRRNGLINALADLFPVVRALVGDDLFRHCAAAFLADRPPRSPVMIGYGGMFARFLAAFAPAAELPYLPDVAALEFALHEAFHAPDAAPFGLAEFQSLPPEILAGLQLALHPSVRLIASAYPIDLIWRAHQGAEAIALLEDLPARAATLLIARPDQAVELRALPQAAFDAVASLRAGATACDGEVLLELFQAGLIVGIPTRDALP